MKIANHLYTIFCAALLQLATSQVALVQAMVGFVQPPASGAESHVPDIAYTVIRGVDGHERGLFYEKTNGFAITEGDIIIGTVEELERTQEEDGYVAQGMASSLEIERWPEGILPYEVDARLSQSMQQRIIEAIEHWEAHTPIRFVERTSANQQQYPDYVRFVSPPDPQCSSMAGRQGGEQPVNLSEACNLVAVIHEIGHALGLWHEHTREDRDAYVRINWENIIPEMSIWFEKNSVNNNDLGDYDYYSIMHYPRWAFSQNGRPTIEPFDSTAPIGEGTGLSEGDIASVRKLYALPETDCDVSMPGYLSRAGDLAFIPANDYASSPAGVHEGHLTGPSHADFNLSLLYWTGTTWGPVAESNGPTSDESISYSGPSGYYLWIIQSNEGSGPYTFCLNRP